jgi:hypothetical protein
MSKKNIIIGILVAALLAVVVGGFLSGEESIIDNSKTITLEPGTSIWNSTTGYRANDNAGSNSSVYQHNFYIFSKEQFTDLLNKDIIEEVYSDSPYMKGCYHFNKEVSIVVKEDHTSDNLNSLNTSTKEYYETTFIVKSVKE